MVASWLTNKLRFHAVIQFRSYTEQERQVSLFFWNILPIKNIEHPSSTILLFKTEHERQWQQYFFQVSLYRVYLLEKVVTAAQGRYIFCGQAKSITCHRQCQEHIKCCFIYLKPHFNKENQLRLSTLTVKYHF